MLSTSSPSSNGNVINRTFSSPQDYQNQPRSSLRRFLAYVKPYWRLLAFATSCGILKFLLPATMAIAMRFVTDHLLPHATGSGEAKDPSFQLTLHYLNWLSPKLPPNWNANSSWGHLCLLMITLTIIYAVWSVSSYYRSYLAQSTAQRVILDLRSDLYQHITRLSHSFFQENQSGGIVSRLMSDISLAQNFIGSAMTTIWMDLASCFFYLYLLFSMDTPLAWASLGVFPFYVLSLRTYGSRAKRTSRRVQDALQDFSGDVQERVAGIGVMKSFAAEGREAKSFYHGARGLYQLQLKNVHVTVIASTITQWLTQMATLCLVWYGGYRVLQGDTSIGTIVAFMILIRELYDPINRISDMNTIVNNSLAGIDRVFEVFDIEPDVQEKPDARRLASVEGNITFENVTFGYNPCEPVLKDINLDVKKGEVVALVGASGAGKSTIVQLVPRFFDPQKGRIFIDGVDVRDVKLRSLRSQIGMVAQETLLFSGTLRENLLYGKPGATDQQLSAAVRAAYVDEFVHSMPRGYDTMLGERGARLSGGQKQRIAIARAFLTDPRILILDEATSALDSESEELIQEALVELMKGRTNLVIAHRLSTILGADRIAVMEQGRILDIGPHEELLERNAQYAKLYNTQFKVALAS
jgi:subfamily B ATP-binding cassette protein MsbA